MALTGDSRRWAERSAVWREGWRTLHHPPPACAPSSSSRTSAAPPSSPAPGAPMTASTQAGSRSSPTASPRARSRSSDGATRSLPTARSCPTGELGSMFDEGPSKLCDALSTILGLEELVEAEAALRNARLALRHRAHRGRFRRCDPVINRGSCRTAIVRLGLMTREEVPAGASFAFDVGLRTLDQQLRRIDALDTKAGVILAAGGVLGGFLFTRGSVLGRAPLALGVAAAGALIACLIAALVAFGVRRYSFVPSVRAVVRMMSADEAWLRWRFLGNMREAVEANEPKLGLKARFVSAAVSLLAAAVGLAGGSVVYTLR